MVMYIFTGVSSESRRFLETLQEFKYDFEVYCWFVIEWAKGIVSSMAGYVIPVYVASIRSSEESVTNLPLVVPDE